MSNIEMWYNELCNIEKHLLEGVRQNQQVIESLFGPMPQPANQTESANKGPEGFIPKINSKLADLNEIIGRMGAQQDLLTDFACQRYTSKEEVEPPYYGAQIERAPDAKFG